jgi:hypothetical protein
MVMLTALSVNTGGLGRFGNQMFTIASTIGIAVKNNQPFAFPEWVNRDNALFGGAADSMEQYFANPLPRLDLGISFQDVPYHWEYKDYSLPYHNWNICSHLQDPRYFEHCMPMIRHYFRMKDHPDMTDHVAIHYRAGDYINDPNAYHPRQTKEYYKQAMELFPSDTLFFLFSDDPKEWYDMMPDKYTERLYAVSNQHYIIDFALMKRCKSFITANSSFSYMAALLGEHPDKKIVMPKNWFGSSAGIKFDGYHKDAIVL